MVTVLKFEVISGKFQIIEIFTSSNYPQK